MGGKAKHVQRTKNNTKPSSSARSAELLGTAPTFVGFSTHSDLGIIPCAPGFTTVEQLPEIFDPNISPQYQMTMKKLSKKDPMTKKKALQEFIDLINSSEIDELKILLPLWPKFYHSLATDPEHNVRELSQIVLQLLVSKCKKAVAPYLKQLVPVWLASQFDNYAPAASIASSSFNETFAVNPNRTREVCLHCQSEILEYTTRNLTFHSASSLSTMKSLTPEESEQKYQRLVLCSLKELSFFVEHTLIADNQPIILDGLKKLLDHQKFWSFAKNKLNGIRAAWFELIYHLLQCSTQHEIFVSKKSQMISIAFLNIDETDPLVAPHIWGAILLIQTNYKDWYETTDFQKNVWPKFTKLLRNAFNRNTQAVCPNILPFFSQLSHITTDLNEYYIIVKEFFKNIRDVITAETSTLNISKQEYKLIIKTYFECLRYIIQKNYANESNSENEEKTLPLQLLEENIVQPIKCCLTNTQPLTTKIFFQHTSTLVAFFDKQSANSSLYQQLLDKFWSLLFTIISTDLDKHDVSEVYIERVIELINDLYIANPSLEEHRVTFVKNSDELVEKLECPATPKEQHSTANFIQKELKQFVVQLLRICLSKTTTFKTSQYIKHVALLCNMFNDKEFFAKVSEDGKLESTLKTFVSLLKSAFLDNEPCEIVVDIVFEILHSFEKQQKFEIIEKELMEISHHLTQTLVLQRLLSYPLCIEPEVRNILSQTKATEVISKIATDVVINNSKDMFNLLHKCFFQTDSGEILISSKTVDSILNILSQPLVLEQTNEEVKTDVDACGSFIAQIMPVVCSNENSSCAVRHEVFLRLFTFSIEKSVNDYISEDTLWEITTCWQDALSSEDIIIENDLLQKCAQVVDNQAMKGNLNITAIDSMAEAMAKFITCSSENTEEESERSLQIDKILKALLKNNAKDVHDFYNVCSFVESLKTASSPVDDFTGNIKNFNDFKQLLQRSLLNFSTVCKLVCKSTKKKDSENSNTNEDEITEDYCDPNENLLKIWSEFLQTELLQYINIAACSDALIIHIENLDKTLETLCIELSEKVQKLLSHAGELSVKLKERLLEQTAKEEKIEFCRSLPYLIHIEQYAQFEESATLLLAEDLQEYFVEQKAFKAYINTLQYLLPKLEAKTVGIQCPIMRCEPTDVWIKATVFRCLIKNNFSSTYNDKSDYNIITSTVQFITEIADKLHLQKDLLLYQTEIHKQEMVNVLNAVEYINLLTEVLGKIPHELSVKNWDVIRIGLGNWILSSTKSLDYALENDDQKTLYFILHVFKLFDALTSFFVEEEEKSSTQLIQNVYDEWKAVFSRDVYLTLFKLFYRICQHQDTSSNFADCWAIYLDELTATMNNMDYGVVYAFCKNSTQISLDHVCNFLLKTLSSRIHSLRTLSVFIMRRLTPHFVADDIKVYDNKSEQIDKHEYKSMKWHFLNRFEDYLGRYDMPIQKYINQFSFKLSEIAELDVIDRHEALSYLMLWHCIIFACAKSPVALRSVYTSWLHENKYEEHLLHFLFRAMPAEILKNHSTKQLNNDIFRGLSWSQIKDRNMPLEKYVCHIYTEVLIKLPAVVRKWWNTSPSRQKTFVDTLTTNFVSPIICQEELTAIAIKKEKHENMQVAVHMSTREVLAVYSIDEARMELVITLAPNYPLGSVKVDCNKQIGGRATSRNVAMQLTIFLTHQNGTIFDGLALWKNNLDKKFEGVEECYVCYTVIHQDTCQLPKLTCKTCKKKFHGPCLYKWFTTSSKSTCPICRNVF